MTAQHTRPRRPGRHRRDDALTTAVCLVGDHLVKAVSSVTTAALATLTLLNGATTDPGLVPAATDRVIVQHLPWGP